MSRNQLPPESSQDSDDSSDDTAVTPSESISPDLTDQKDSPAGGVSYPSCCFVPEPGLTYIIRSVWSRQIITLLKGQVVLAPPGGFGCPHWESRPKMAIMLLLQAASRMGEVPDEESVGRYATYAEELQHGL
ncbi:hypothetical protein BP6252_11308 [Coleophoma cylindrospora]|uniref:Uncharacterized protein n=1 Tax=Coleophoma cylindrospora TaxID=1849047 RepID=A0A3D8QPL1_9HELO|nr:hypothetical protein BP6252_11308 [Coleophoma cylindrospora]